MFLTFLQSHDRVMKHPLEFILEVAARFTQKVKIVEDISHILAGIQPVILAQCYRWKAHLSHRLKHTTPFLCIRLTQNELLYKNSSFIKFVLHQK